MDQVYIRPPLRLLIFLGDIDMDGHETDMWLESLFSGEEMVSSGKEDVSPPADKLPVDEDEAGLLKRCASMLTELGEPIKCHAEIGGYNFSTAKGERSLAGVAQQDVNEMDRFQADLLDMVDGMQASTTTGELATAMRDPGTRAPWVSLSDVSGVVYAVSDRVMEVCIDPNRSRTLLEPLLKSAQYEDVGGVVPLLAQVLDAQCSVAGSCTYPYFYKQYTGSRGPISLNAKTCLTLTVGVQLAGSSRARLRDIVDTLIDLLLSQGGMGGGCEGTRRGSNRLSDLCICCQLVNQAGNSFDALSEMVYEECDSMVRTRSAAFIGLAERRATTLGSEHERVDLFSDILQICGNKRYNISDGLSFSDYDVVREKDLWLVVYKGAKSHPKPPSSH